jgi:hypothetical protein
MSRLQLACAIALFLLVLVTSQLIPWRASCQTGNCPGWPCRTNADCQTGGDCACSGTQTGVGHCR